MSEFIYTKEKPLRVFTAFSGYDSQCYKLFGNSIVVNCMVGIFKNAFSTEEIEQTTLF